ncbi:hypothetical protein FE257_000883 [Aspergillus nanangensis]|uniref:Uncharacterized protein n=1 Tax=Aspergillus nanangensis TaxID=2582783 RepID=A0AAD4CFQ2_ASPNN|nr:hypothetical protein FE257_000883 [Aspergillus nanangensis]
MWENNEIGGRADVGHFQSILSSLDLPAANEYAIRLNDPAPGQGLMQMFTTLLNTAKATSGRSLVVVHYTGHAKLMDGNFYIGSYVLGGDVKTINMDIWFFGLILRDHYILDDNSKVDILFILDCCYAHTAVRNAAANPRVVQILAATDQTSPPANTFTAKLAGEIAHRKRQGHEYVDFANIIETLRGRARGVVKPSNLLKLGASSIHLPFSRLSSVDPKGIPPTLRAVFSVNIAENMTPDRVTHFIAWIRALPPSMTVTLEGVYQTESMVLILQSAYSVYSKLAGMKGYHLICEPSGPSMGSSQNPWLGNKR